MVIVYRVMSLKFRIHLIKLNVSNKNAQIQRDKSQTQKETVLTVKYSRNQMINSKSALLMNVVLVKSCLIQVPASLVVNIGFNQNLGSAVQLKNVTLDLLLKQMVRAKNVMITKLQIKIKESVSKKNVRLDNTLRQMEPANNVMNIKSQMRTR